MTSACAALASMTVVRPDGAVPAALERAVRAACAGAWRALEVALAGDALRTRLDGADGPVKAGVEAVLGLVAAHDRAGALRELRAARERGVLDDGLDVKALVASCGRAGDNATVAAGRRRVRTLGVEALRKALAGEPALAAALRDSALVTLLIDSARAMYRHATRGDKDLSRWAPPPTGTTTRDQALTSFAELASSSDALASLDRLLASLTSPEPVRADVAASVSAPEPVAAAIAESIAAAAALPAPAAAPIAEALASPPTPPSPSTQPSLSTDAATVPIAPPVPVAVAAAIADGEAATHPVPVPLPAASAPEARHEPTPMPVVEVAPSAATDATSPGSWLVPVIVAVLFAAGAVFLLLH